MSAFELIHLSMTNKKTNRIVKLFTKNKPQNKLKINVFITKEAWGVFISRKRSVWEYKFTSDESCVGGITYDESHGRRYWTLRKYSRDKLVELKKISDYSQDIFGLKLNGIFFDMKTLPNQNQLIIDWLKTKQESYRWSEVYGQSDDDLKHLLDNLRFSKSLKIWSKIKENFHAALPENVEELWILHAQFVKLEQILKLNCKRLSLKATTLNNQDIYVFLKKWMNSESNLNLVFFQVQFSAPTNDIFQDIPNEVGEDIYFVAGFHPQFVQGGKNIKRNDGKTARILFDRENFKMIMKMFIY